MEANNAVKSVNKKHLSVVDPHKQSADAAPDGETGHASVAAGYDSKPLFPNVNITCCGLVCFSTDSLRSVIFINDGLLEMLGYSSKSAFESAAGQSFVNSIHPEDLSSFEAYLKRACGVSGTGQFICRIRRSDASFGWFMLRKSPECSSDTHDSITCSCVDISGLVELQKKATRQEVLLSNTKRELAAIIENAPGGVRRCRLYDGVFLEFASDGLCQTIGYTRDEIRTLFGDKYSLIVCEEDRQYFKDAMGRLAQYQHTEHLRYRLRCKNGRIIWVADTIKSVRDQEGKMWSYAVVTDIDKDQLAHLELKALTDSIPAGVATYEYRDGRYRLKYCNECLCQSIGIANDEYIKSAEADPFAHINKSCKDEFYNDLAKMLGSGESFDSSVMVNTSYGLRWFRMIIRVIERRPDSVLFNAIFVDITQRKEQEKLFAFQKSCADILDTALSAGTIINGLGLDKPLLYASQNIVNLLGYSVGEFSRMYEDSYAAVIHPADFKRVIELNERYAVERPPRFEMEFRFIKKDGTVIWVMEKAVWLDDFMGQCAYLSVFVDISELKRVQEQLRIGEEEYAIAVEHCNSIVCRYNIAAKSIDIPPQIAKRYQIPVSIQNVPQRNVDMGLVAPESVPAYRHLYEATAAGENVSGVEILHKMAGTGSAFKWFRCSSTVIFDEEGMPASAVMTFDDINKEKQQESELSALRENSQLLRIIARNSHKQLLRYNIAEDDLLPFDALTKKYFTKSTVHQPLEYFVTKGIIAPEYIEAARNFKATILSGRHEGAVECRLKNLKGSWQWYRLIFANVFNEGRVPLYAIITAENITAAREKEIAFQRYREMLKSSFADAKSRMEFNLTADLLESCDCGILATFSSERPARFNAVMRELTERCIWQQDRKTFVQFADRIRLLNAFAAGTTQDSCEARVNISGGRSVWMRIDALMVSDPYSSDVKLLLYWMDIDARKRSELELLARTQIDGLTSVYNRATFEEKILEKAKKADRTLLHAFAIIDIDNFKDINDRFGHPYGDEVLRDVARTISSMVFKEDIVGRIGGDEFAVCLSNFPSLDLLREKLRILGMAVNRKLDGSKYLTISIGVAMCPVDGHTFEELYRKADLALYQAKRNGKNKYVFYSGDISAEPSPRTPIDEPEHRRKEVSIRTFGYFDVFVDGKPLLFHYAKTKELLALLVDRRGGFVAPAEAIGCLWEDETANRVTLARYRKVAFRLHALLSEAGIERIVESKRGSRRIVPETVECDLYDYVAGDIDTQKKFRGDYMTNYSWGESTLASLEFGKN